MSKYTSGETMNEARTDLPSSRQVRVVPGLTAVVVALTLATAVMTCSKLRADTPQQTRELAIACQDDDGDEPAANPMDPYGDDEPGADPFVPHADPMDPYGDDEPGAEPLVPHADPMDPYGDDEPGADPDPVDPPRDDDPAPMPDDPPPTPILADHAATSTVTATVQFVEGDVSIRTGEGEWRDAVKGEQLHPGDEIHTGPESSAIIRFSDGSTVIIRPLTETEIGEMSGHPNRPKIRMLLKMGEVAAKVNHEVDQEADFAIRTPNLTASVRGTEFRVYHGQIADSDEASVVMVEKGKVLVTPTHTSLKPVTLIHGQAVAVTTDAVSPVQTVIP